MEPKRPQKTMWWIVSCCMSKAIRAQAHAHVRAPTPAGTHAHGCTHPRARANTRTQICNTYCFSTVTMVSWARHSDTLYVHCVPCFVFTTSCPERLSQVRHADCPALYLYRSDNCRGQTLVVVWWNQQRQRDVVWKALPSYSPRFCDVHFLAAISVQCVLL